jgi:hypothetical protein
MAQLIKYISADLYTNIEDSVNAFQSVYGEIQQNDYVNINGFIAFLQNLKQAEKTYAITNPINFGLKNQYNLSVITLNVDY